MMKIRQANTSDLNALKLLWEECFLEHDSQASIDYYFKNNFILDDTFVLIDDEELRCSLQINQHNLIINNVVEPTSFVVGVATFIKDRHKGYMKKLLNYVIEYVEKELKQNFMILQAYNWDIYRPFGFKDTYYKNIYNYINEYHNHNITYIENKEETMFNIYNKYTSGLDGYKQRDQEYYINWLNSLMIDNAQSLVIENAYIIYTTIDDVINISECAYTNYQDLLKLIQQSFKDKQKIILASDIKNKLPLKLEKKELFMMVKILGNVVFDVDALYISEWV